MGFDSFNRLLSRYRKNFVKGCKLDAKYTVG